MVKTYETKEEIFNEALSLMEKCLFDVIDKEEIVEVQNEIEKNGKNRKGLSWATCSKICFSSRAC
ncbi:hypothetical protein GW758_01880 [Candidatus Falkowbacteria bacterium]|nr:hypothetical protein [Candidatus Falkowbacteria bacterium]